MSFPYKHVLIIGATSGIGKSMADKLVTSGVSVTAVGRRKDRLDDFVNQHGSEKASSIVFDIAKQAEIPAFAAEALKTHLTIDAVFLNAGVQGHHAFDDPPSVNLKQVHSEIQVNFLSQVDLVHAFLPHLLASPGTTAFIYTGTNISLVPAHIVPAYSASKTALEAFMLSVKEQIKDKGVKVFHLSAPPVQTEIHDREMGVEAGRSFGMPVAQFTEEAFSEIVAGNQDIYIGAVGGSTREQVLEMAGLRLAAFARMAELIRKMAASRG
ncbi:oxidoreductase [Lophiostoma macrostomum CBS 122681]|uniref:Oxidoreductase n=1 Tax=Lophiostoma macrostomum CBS 122681 TaxID=1314788 RepID=A0A6A6T131_9PLEO|nr:oxidoreductase [Lophiostoma macrostomum CBS 122681]